MDLAGYLIKWTNSARAKNQVLALLTGVYLNPRLLMCGARRRQGCL